MIKQIKRTSMMLLCAIIMISTLIVRTYASTTNYVPNGDFNQGTEHWSMNQSDGSNADMSSDKNH